ncbi:MAG TPA: penicillin-binding protein [Bacillus bacterium]|nr:penicillin-binding protein [Bacillus sp. (in: firmicutes)]
MLKNIEELAGTVSSKVDFSGVVLVEKDGKVIYQAASGYSNRADELLNSAGTKFGIASGSKLFTSIGIAQLVEKGMLAFDTKLKDCLDIVFPHFDENITLHHLLTHTSGIPDYFDEGTMDDYEDLWKERPMYKMKRVIDFLPMFQNSKMMFSPGERFHYNNAGFIVLGMVIEQATGLAFTEYIETNVFARCGMEDSGYYSLDNLPKDTAYGYIDHEDGSWRSNIYCIAIRGGADGGAFVSAPDMVRFWQSLLEYKLLTEEFTIKLMTPYVNVKEEEYYGYGIWIRKSDGEIFKYHVLGYDPGISFHSAFYPQSGLKVAIPSNKSLGAYAIMKAIEGDI